MKRARLLKQFLILSLALNGLFVGIFFYFLLWSSPLHFAYAPSEILYIDPPDIAPSFLKNLQEVSFEHLVELLEDSTLVDQGYKVQDFALGALVSYHAFDVQRALMRGRLAQKKWEYDNGYFLLFPNLEQSDFEKLYTFATTQNYPQTAEGIFELIHQQGIDHSSLDLLTYFCHTSEFVLLETLFARASCPIQKKTLLALVLESGWDILETLCNNLEQKADFSHSTRREFLLSCVASHSPTAAQLLLKTDFQYACSHLRDEQIEGLLDLIDPKQPESQELIEAIAHSCRGDAVHEKAVAGHFYEKPGLKELRPAFRQQPPAAPEPSIHIIQPGESLWIIARKYHLSIEQLMEINHLSSTVIQPGKTLKIP